MAKLLEEDYPELFHYTGISGLEGIVKSQTLWATHALFMNDTTELREFKGRLHDILRPAFESFTAKMYDNPTAHSIIDQHGGYKNAIDEYMTFYNHMYEYTLLGTSNEQAFADPFVLSFCTHDDKDIKQHGLLSQWRGYGQEGGYALVFDTASLSRLLEQEGKKWTPGYDLFGGNVVYSNEPDDKFREEFGSDIETIAKSFLRFLEKGSPDILGDIYTPLIRCACRYKHWGFHEEKEIRFIAIPPNKHTYSLLVEERKLTGLLTDRVERRHFVRAGSPVPCLHLFDGVTQLPDSPLPITRIIVGPHRDKEQRRRAIESLLEQYQLNIPVSVSRIPYVRNY